MSKELLDVSREYDKRQIGLHNAISLRRFPDLIIRRSHRTFLMQHVPSHDDQLSRGQQTVMRLQSPGHDLSHIWAIAELVLYFC